MRGLLITLEGIEGSGKSTQAKLLHANFKKHNLPVELTREPGGTRIAETIRQILLNDENSDIRPLTELLLYEAARAQHVDEIIKPALLSGKTVISDRYVDSTTAYQGAGRSIPLQTIQTLHEIATQGIWPNLTLVLDVPIKEGLKRVQTAGKLDRMEHEPESFHERVRDFFLVLAKQEPERIRVIDGSRCPQVIADEIWEVVMSFWERHG